MIQIGELIHLQIRGFAQVSTLRDIGQAVKRAHKARTSATPLALALQSRPSRVTTTHHSQPQNHTTPKQHIIQQRPSPHPLTPLHHHNRHLQHHSHKPIPPKLPCNTAHDQLMRKGRDEERDDSGKRARHMAARGAVDVAAEEVVDGFVPFAAEFKPVAGVPPVGVEFAVGEACGSASVGEEERDRD